MGNLKQFGLLAVVAFPIFIKLRCTRRLRLAAIAHIYPILLYIARYSCLLARTTRVGVTVERSVFDPMVVADSTTRNTLSRQAHYLKMIHLIRLLLLYTGTYWPPLLLPLWFRSQLHVNFHCRCSLRCRPFKVQHTRYVIVPHMAK
jgi:hypothetical protein